MTDLMTDLLIRQWQERDRVALGVMVAHCLEINHAAGADMLPTAKNALALVEVGMLASERGEPCLVAATNEGPIGYTLWCELPNPLRLDFAGRVLHGLGTYVMPPFQRQGVSGALRDAAEAQARRLGFTKVVGVAYHQAGLHSVLARGYGIAGYHVERCL